VRFDDLQGIFDRYDTKQNVVELSDETGHFDDRELFENQYYEVMAKFNELLHPVVHPPPSRHSCQHISTILQDHTRLAHTLTTNHCIANL